MKSCLTCSQTSELIVARLFIFVADEIQMPSIGRFKRDNSRRCHDSAMTRVLDGHDDPLGISFKDGNPPFLSRNLGIVFPKISPPSINKGKRSVDYSRYRKLK